MTAKSTTSPRAAVVQRWAAMGDHHLDRHRSHAFPSRYELVFSPHTSSPSFDWLHRCPCFAKPRLRARAPSTRLTLSSSIVPMFPRLLHPSRPRIAPSCPSFPPSPLPPLSFRPIPRSVPPHAKQQRLFKNSARSLACVIGLLLTSSPDGKAAGSGA